MQHPIVNGYIARAIVAERRAQADAYRRVHPRERRPAAYADVTIRRAGPHDALDLERLAQLDARAMPSGVVLVAEVAGRMLAARSLETGATVADPFRPTQGLVGLLELRAAHLGFRPRLRRRLGARLAAILRRRPHPARGC